MADTASTTGTDGVDETPTQRQARLRREKRAKKMAEQGEDRLAKIKALNGGAAPPEEVLGGPTLTAPKVASVADDPDEVDISTTPNFTNNSSNANAQPQNDPFAAMLQSQPGSSGAEGDDPFVRMMQQMMGTLNGQPQGSNNPGAQPPQLPPFLQSMMKGGGGQEDQPQPSPSTGSAYMWRIVHAVFAFALAGYISFTSTFNGSVLLRNQSVYDAEEESYGFGTRLVVIFTSAELILQSSRYFLEKGQLQGGGVLAKVANSGFIPEPYTNYIRIVGRYIGIAQTIFSDVMVIIFVFGAMAWWNGVAAS